MKTQLKKLFLLLFFLVLLTLSFSVKISANECTNDENCKLHEVSINSTHYSSLKDAVDATGDEETTIKLLIDIELSSSIVISKTQNIILDGNNHTITRGKLASDSWYTGNFFTVNGDASALGSLTIKNLIIDSGNNWSLNEKPYWEMFNAAKRGIRENGVNSSGQTIWVNDYELFLNVNSEDPTATDAMFKNYGNLIVEGCTIKNHYTTSTNNGIFRNFGSATTIVRGGNENNSLIVHNASRGSGLVFNTDAKTDFYLEDGATVDSNFVGSNGGICRLYSGGQVTMNGGEIKNTTGLNSNGTVAMMYGSGGSVENNTFRKSSFVMNGGTISGNTGVYGLNNGRNAPIYLHNNAFFEMNGGVIENNSGISTGGIDAARANNVLNLNAGTIQNNNVTSPASENKSDVSVSYDINTSIGKEMTINGNIKAAGDLENNGTINGNVTLSATTNDDGSPSKIEGSGTINGDLVITYIGDVAPEISPNLKVTGQIVSVNQDTAVLFTYSYNNADLNGETIKELSYDRRTKITVYPIPQVEGYILEGWYTDTTLETKFDFENYVIPDIPEEGSSETRINSVTLYAKWIETSNYYEIKDIESVQFTGKNLEPTLEVVYINNNNDASKDVKIIKYENNLNVGTATIFYKLSTDPKTYTKTFTITKASISKPTINNASHRYNGNEIEQSVQKHALYTISGNKATSIGVHTLTISLVDKKNSTWDDGTTEDLTFTWEITAAVVQAIWEYKDSYTFNGYVQNEPTAYFIDVFGNKVELYPTEKNGKPFKNVDEYTFCVYHIFSDYVIENYEHTVFINPLNIENATISLENDLVYTGELLTQNIKEVKVNDIKVSSYTVINNIATNAGTYVLTILGTDNYYGKASVSFTVAKADYDMSNISFEDKTFIYDGLSHNTIIDGTLPTGKDGLQVSVTYSSEEVTNVSDGEKIITATFATESSNYNVPASLKATIRIVPKDVDTIWSTLDNYTFNGKQQLLPTATFKDVTGKDVSLNVSEKNSMNFLNSSTYTFIASCSDSNYIINNNQKEISISPLDITNATISLGSTLTYNGELQTQEVISVIVNGIEATYTIEGNKVTNAGKYTLTITGTSNFTGKISIEFEVNKANYDMSQIKFESKIFEPNGNPQTITITGSLPTGKDGIQVTVNYSGETVTKYEDGEKIVTATFSTLSTNYNVPEAMTAKISVFEEVKSFNTINIILGVTCSLGVGLLILQFIIKRRKQTKLFSVSPLVLSLSFLAILASQYLPTIILGIIALLLIIANIVIFIVNKKK